MCTTRVIFKTFHSYRAHDTMLSSSWLDSHANYIPFEHMCSLAEAYFVFILYPCENILLLTLFRIPKNGIFFIRVMEFFYTIHHKNSKLIFLCYTVRRSVYIARSATQPHICKMQTELCKFSIIVGEVHWALNGEKTFYIVIKFQPLKITVFMLYLHYYHDYI